MIKLKWELLDDEWFVLLAADVLIARGYAIQYQGAGPDGGVDIFATQTILIGFDIQPFTWAVQCKFSRSPAKAKAVNDSEIKDIEGILRSSRYQTLKPRGYMLVTNRRIAQNVIERLRGVNDQTAFRTCAMDGKRLTTFLAENTKLVLEYFTDSAKLTVASDKHVEALGQQIKAAVKDIMIAYRSSQVFLPDLHLLRRTLAEADREVEVAILRAVAISPEDEHDRDIDYYYKQQGRMARKRLQQMGVSLRDETERRDREHMEEETNT